MTTGTVLTTASPGRSEDDLGRRFNASAYADDSKVTPNEDFESWFAEQRRVNRFEVTRIPFGELEGWGFQAGTGNLVHDSGKFFAVEGLQVSTDWQDRGSWSQPILNQPEVGVLGIAVKEFDGVLHCLMQAKMEPGNLNTVQLSPTVQATRSNYTGVHRGRQVAYMEYFAPPGRRSRILVDSLQSEQGSWFLRKRNRNMVVEITEDVDPSPNFRWLTIGQLHRLLRRDNVINMDARTVLSCIPFAPPDGTARTPGDNGYRESLLRSMSAAQDPLHSTGEILSWLTEVRSRHEVLQRSVPLHQVRGWRTTEDEISHEEGRHFKVIAANVAASNREVARWTQPLIAPTEQGLAAFLARPVNGVLHLLVHAKMEAGILNVAELAPTVMCLRGNFAGLPEKDQPRFLDLVTETDPAARTCDAVQSEEGGRFFHADTRYQVIQVGEDFPLEVPSGYRWMTVRQLTGLLRHSNYVNVQARSLLAALHTTW
ncbi:NDP-hexose 2,3-dehydratase family protein [Streptomyces inhibens]|uniref:NDP-hexose 2,3-dehydratase family protein n=1 Tax=Streptomyces inhibens TaxID=2293571 RepID=UPI001EE73C86|nr:NDP-hexose 2,3-dehydratase family protein [Streptomyces inhibens]UKY51794.1 NDP-hexose 2,3-dehydratase family protein [Streptomyces inhibens]